MPAVVHGITFHNLERITHRFEQIEKRVPGAVSAGITAAAHAILLHAKALTPVDTGVLQASGTILSMGNGKTQSTVQFGFSALRRNYDYALIQHEREDYNHTVGTHHYLSKAIDAAGSTTGMKKMREIIYNELFR